MILDLVTETRCDIAVHRVDVIGDIASELLAATTDRARKEGLAIEYQIGRQLLHGAFGSVVV